MGVNEKKKSKDFIRRERERKRKINNIFWGIMTLSLNLSTKLTKSKLYSFTI